MENRKEALDVGDPLRMKREAAAVLTFEDAAREVHRLHLLAGIRGGGRSRAAACRPSTALAFSRQQSVADALARIDPPRHVHSAPRPSRATCALVSSSWPSPYA